MINFFILILCLIASFFAKTGAAKTLFIMLMSSIIFTFFLGDILPTSVTATYYAAFVCSILFLLFYSFNFIDSKKISEYSVNKLELKLIRYLIKLSIIGVISNSYILLEMMINFFSGNISIEIFKNGEIGLAHFKEINIIPRLISAALSPLSYLCLPLHFYFLVHERNHLSRLAFIGSLSIILDQLAFFGRGGIVVFMLTYIVMFIFIYPKLTRQSKKKSAFLFLVLLIPVVGAFTYIAIDRFSSFTGFDYDGSINNPIIVSIFSYYSQWLKNGYNVYIIFDIDNIIYFSNFMYLPDKLMGLFGFSEYDLNAARENAFGSLATYFNGLPALMLYDLNYIGSYIFALSFFVVFRIFIGSKSTHCIGKYKFIAIGLLIPIPVMFFQGLHTIHGAYNVAFVYFILLFLLAKLRIDFVRGNPAIENHATHC